MIAPPASMINNPQSLVVVIVDPSGNVQQQSVYYDPTKGGIDIHTPVGGDNASIYIPAWRTGYVWLNGHWVDETGYYWEGRTKKTAGIPNWNQYWSGYWGKYRNDPRGYWSQGRKESASMRKWRDRKRDLQQKQMEAGKIKGFGEKNVMPSPSTEKSSGGR